MGNTYRRRYIWFTHPEGEPAAYPPAPDGLENDPPPESPEPFRAKILVNPTMAEVRHERESMNALVAETLSEPEYLQEIAHRVIDWNLKVAGFNKTTGQEEILEVAAPGQYPDNPDSIQGFYELTAEQLGWLLVTIRIGHLPKVTTPKLMPVSSTGSNGEQPQRISETDQSQTA